MNTEALSYRDLLKKEFVDRKNRNTHYSLRAFARDLDLSASRLSEVFSGDSHISLDSAKKITDRLGYSKYESTFFCDLVEMSSSRNELSRKAAELRIKNRKNIENYQLSKEFFSIIAEWHHFAILELSTFDEFQDNPQWIAEKLNISAAQAKVSLEKLSRLGLMIRNDKDVLVAKDEFTFSPDGVSSRALRYAHDQLIRLGLLSLQNDPLEVRDFSNILIGFSEDQMEKARELIKDFRVQFQEQLPRSQKQKRVYSLAIQLFPLSK